MDKNDYIVFWKKMAERDWEAVESLYASKNFVQSLFFAHLVIEKYLKAIWIRDNIENVPPLVHNLEYLYNQTQLNLPSTLVDLLHIINSWNIDGRYQDYKDKFYQKCTPEYTREKLDETTRLLTCLRSELP